MTRELLDLANNPLFVRYVRARLRPKSLRTEVIVVVLLSLCIVCLNWLIAKFTHEEESPFGSHAFFWFQGLILVVVGGSRVAAAIAQLRERDIIDFHRISPVPSKVQTIGIMMGAPIRELLLYAITLPFALLVAVIGPFGLRNFIKLLLMQLGSAVMYFSLAIIAGFVCGKPRGATGRYVTLLVVVNVSAIVVYSLGICAPALVTATPVYVEVMQEIHEAAVQKKQLAMQKQAGNLAPPQNPQPRDETMPDVTFYGEPLPLVLQSLIFQGCIAAFLFIAASRRIRSARMPLYYKPTALLFMCLISLLTLGSLWKAPTVLLTFGLTYFFTVVVIVLTNTVTPTLGEVVKGIQRAQKLSTSWHSVWSDLASNKLIVVMFAVIVMGTLSFGLAAAPQPPARMFQMNDFEPVACVLTAVLTILSYGFASQYFALAFDTRAKAYFNFFLFFAWMAPIIIGIILAVCEVEEGAYAIAMSPLAGIAMSGCTVPQLDRTTMTIVSIAPVAICSVFFFSLLLFKESRLCWDVDSGRALNGRDSFAKPIRAPNSKN
jgi:hypothetical protein